MSKPKLTVLMTVKNGEPYIKDCVNEVVNQTYINFDFLILDNASSDNSVDIVNAFNDKRIKLVRLEADIGQVAALNIGLDLIDSPLVARIDADDIMHRGRLKEQVEYLNNNPNVAAVGSHYRHIDEEGKYLEEISCPIGIESNLIYIVAGHNPVGHPQVMYRTKIIQNIGSYRENYKYSEDTDLWLRLYRSGYYCDNVPKILTFSRRHAKRSSVIFEELQHKNHKLAYFDFYKELVNNNITYNEIEQYLNVLVWGEKVTISDMKKIITLALTMYVKILSHSDKYIDKNKGKRTTVRYLSGVYIGCRLIVSIAKLLKYKNITKRLITSILKRMNFTRIK